MVPEGSYHVHKSPPLVTVLNQMNPFYILTPYFLCFNSVPVSFIMMMCGGISPIILNEWYRKYAHCFVKIKVS
jgi:hypothetical protein